MTAAQFRRLALGLSETVESSHSSHPDFRVRNRVFATLGYPDPRCGMVRLTPEQQKELGRAGIISSGRRRLGPEREYDRNSLDHRCGVHSSRPPGRLGKHRRQNHGDQTPSLGTWTR